MIWHGQDQIGLRAIPTSADMGGFVCITLYAPTFFGVKFYFLLPRCQSRDHNWTSLKLGGDVPSLYRLACVDGNYLHTEKNKKRSS